jgi:hypothetical protein
MAETCYERRSKVTIISCISDGYVLYEMNGIKVAYNLKKKIELWQ